MILCFHVEGHVVRCHVDLNLYQKNVEVWHLQPYLKFPAGYFPHRAVCDIVSQHFLGCQIVLDMTGLNSYVGDF